VASTYLTGSDLTAFGVPSATLAQVQAASGIVDGFLQRPAGCVYDPADQIMLNTGIPIIETPRGRRIAASYMPVGTLISVQSWQGGAWTTAPYTFGVDAEGAIYTEPYGYDTTVWFHGLLRQLQVTYLGGWLYSELPFAIKQATANILMAQQQIQSPAFSMAKAGDTQYTRASKSLIDDDTKTMLAPYQRMFAW
jgi:hypothetical protein